MRHTLLVVLPLTACLEPRPGVEHANDKLTLQSALCEYQARCGYIGASEEAACSAAPSFGHLLLDGRPLWRESAAYSTTEALRAGRLALDRARADACLASLAEMTCAASEVLACLTVLTPRVPAGGYCEDDRECVTRICAQSMGDREPWSGDPGCGGRCAEETRPRVAPSVPEAPPPAAEGEPCEMRTGLGGLAGLGTFPFTERGGCAAGLYCDVPAGVGTCRVTLPDGAACDRPDVCTDRRPCVGLTLTTFEGELVSGGTCAPWSDLGGECAPDAAISGCPRDMHCAPGDATCVPREVPTVPFQGECDPAPDAARADQCAEGMCDPGSGTCALRCDPP